nr:MAG TPA: hypothetical protein [Caudoviricetes sp.]
MHSLAVCEHSGNFLFLNKPRKCHKKIHISTILKYNLVNFYTIINLSRVLTPL